MVEEGSTVTRVATRAIPTAAAVSLSMTSKIRVVAACSTAEDGFIDLDGGRNVVIDNIKNGPIDNFDCDDGEHKAWISGGLSDEEQNLWRGVSVRNEEEKEGRNEENVEGLVRKSKRFLPINLTNPKGASFGVEKKK